ncbi:helix-turn-helix transcriptional regulator, partial [Bacteroidota bacterium]
PTTQSIQEYLDDEGFSITKRSLQRDFQDIARKMDIEIVRKGTHPSYWYEIESEPESLPTAYGYLEHAMMASVMRKELEDEKLHRRALILDSPMSEGLEYIPKCLPAIRKNRMISIDYHKFDGPVQNRIVCPFYLKQFRKRWYLIARDTTDDVIKSFGLDRIESLSVLIETFTPEKNVEHLFDNVIGFFELDEEPETIQIWSEKYNANYIRTLRLHHSQKEIGEKDGGIVFELKVVPNFEFFQEILRMAENVKIIGPESVRNKMRERVLAISSHYN